mmetsp:Transcript_116209/g.363498  ORF Transcript_116209/g.363498 Transcript_116209/m.363498 type:complete len:299 (-) Transcript_116209:145-1041(-)
MRNPDWHLSSVWHKAPRPVAMDPVAKERRVLSILLDRCVAELESIQREQLRRHKIAVEELVCRELDRYCKGAHLDSNTNRLPEDLAQARGAVDWPLEVFLFYVAFVLICVLNIVTGVFVDTVHQMYRPEREELVQREIAKRKAVLNNIRDLLEEADEDGSGTITWEEFEDFTSDEQIRMYLSSLEIGISQAREVFELIDSDCKDEVSIDEFVIGFLELKGAAKGADVAILRNNFRKLSNKLSQFMSYTSKHLHELTDLVQRARQDFWIVGGGLEGLTFAGGASQPDTRTDGAVEFRAI